MRSGKLSRRLVVAVILLAGLLGAVDVVALQVFQSRGQAELARGMGAERASIDLGGFPFLPGYLRGELDDVSVEVTGAAGAGLRVASVELRMAEASFAPGAMFSLLRTRYATRTPVDATEVFGRVEISEGDLEAFLIPREPSITDIRVNPSGIEMDLTGMAPPPPEPDQPAPPEPPRARFLPRVEELDVGGARVRKLVLRLVGRSSLTPEQVAAAERIEAFVDLPRVPDGLQTNVSLGNGVFAVEAAGPTVRLLVGEGGARTLGPERT